MNKYFIIIMIALLSFQVIASEKTMPVFEAGHSSLQEWLLPEIVNSPKNNLLTPERVLLGKQLFVDPRLSGTKQSTCIWCHTPERGWADGQSKALLLGGRRLSVSTPSLMNIAYNKFYMWDGRRMSLEDEAFKAQKKSAAINALSTIEPEDVIKRLKNINGYNILFNNAYPKQGLTRTTVAYALSSFERSLISDNSPFDQWIRGDSQAMTEQQINGFKLFLDEKKGNCVSCHNPPNFTDDGFHNIGIKEYENENHNVGRFKHLPFKIMDGAFKTPTLRDVSLSQPYMHDGSIATLKQVIQHYVKGGEAKSNLSPSMKSRLNLNNQEQDDIEMFLHALTTKHKPFKYPSLPQD